MPLSPDFSIICTMSAEQADLFVAPILPGLAHGPAIVTPEEERALIAWIGLSGLAPFASRADGNSRARIRLDGTELRTLRYLYNISCRSYPNVLWR